LEGGFVLVLPSFLSMEEILAYPSVPSTSAFFNLPEGLILVLV